MRRNANRGTYVAGKTHRIRVAITVSETSAASASSELVEVPSSLSRIPGSWSPTRTNSTEFSTKTRISQKASPWSRVCAVVSSGVCHPM
jgi:hypothetical protein